MFSEERLLQIIIERERGGHAKQYWKEERRGKKDHT